MNDHELKLKFTADTAGAQKGIDGLSKSHGELMRSARELSRAFPEVAASLRLLAGPAGAIFVGIEAFNRAKEALDEWNKSLDDAIAKNADPIFLDGIKAKKEAIENFRVALEAHRQEMEKSRSATDEYSASLARQTAALQDMDAAQKSVHDAFFDLDVARLKSELDHGLIAQQQYFDAYDKLVIAKRHKDEKAELEHLQRELAMKQAAFAHYEASAPGLAAASNAAYDAAGAAQAKKDQNDHDLAMYEGRQADLDKIVSDLESPKDIFGARVMTFNPKTGRNEPTRTPQQQADYEQAQAAAAQNAQQVASLKGMAPSLDSAAQRTAQEEKDHAEEEKKNKEDRQTLSDAMNGLKDAINSKSEQFGLSDAALDLKTLLGSPGGADINSAAFVANHLAGATSSQKNAMAAVVEELTRQRQTWDSAAQWLRIHSSNMSQMTTLIQHLFKNEEEDRARIMSLRGIHSNGS